MTAVGVLVFLTLVLMPGLEIAARLYLLLPLRFGRVPPGVRRVAARLLDTMRRWSMVEVFVLAAVVCMHRLAQIAKARGRARILGDRRGDAAVRGDGLDLRRARPVGATPAMEELRERHGRARGAR